MALLEARPYRPFKSSEEYLEAMREDLAEWLSTLYPDLQINADNFMDRLDTGVALCKHANYVRQAAEDYLARRQARNKSMTRSMTSGSAGPILAMGNVHYLPAAKSGTFFARDNVSNFITWCRKSLKIIECLLFETDDLIMRKNEKHVILCLLEVARRGAKFGMLAPMLVQMERQIDREIAADNKANGVGYGLQTEGKFSGCTQADISVGTNDVATEVDFFDTDSENDDEDDEGPMLMYGPQPQIITNDLKSLDEMVRDLVEKCTCPSQFPMIRVSEGKYRIGDTKVLIFVRILRSHVMVRVGGGWDTLAHYLDKHDPCRCKAQHRSSVAARLIPRTNNQTNGIELHKAQVIFERSPPTSRKIVLNCNNQIISNQMRCNNASISPSLGNNTINNLSGFQAESKTRSRSPTPQRKFFNQQVVANTIDTITPNNAEKVHQSASNGLLSSPFINRRSMSPSPRRLIDMRKKQSSLDSSNNGSKLRPSSNEISSNHVQFERLNLGQVEVGEPVNIQHNSVGEPSTNTNKFENVSDNGSEISDEGYRSLGVIQSNLQKRESLYSQNSMDDAENNVRQEQTSSESPLSPIEDQTISAKTPEISNLDYLNATCDSVIDGPQSLPVNLSLASMNTTFVIDKFEQSGVFITDDDITVDIASSTGLKKTNFSNKIFGIDESANSCEDNKSGIIKSIKVSKIPRSPVPQRRRSIDNGTCSGSLQDLSSNTGLSAFNRKKPIYRSVRKPHTPIQTKKSPATCKQPPFVVREITNTWNDRTTNTAKKRTPINIDTFNPIDTATTTYNGPFERNIKTRSSQTLYDSNGRRIKGCTVSLTTSPVKNHTSSSLAQQLLEAASSAKNDAQILEKMKCLLSRYSSSNQPLSSSKPINKKPMYDDFTTAWVHNNGNLERSNSCSPPTRTGAKRGSAASSTESTHSRDMSVIVSPRRDRGISKIPAPVRQHTELY
ncbi:GAS2-like protein pickled eggs [Teleopsis dalmanni]|uniref:GAS2-like protein pickled eggs n=1 Tax=Teleopsis dalmanni TaxID=139649 RepID=UPI0018CD9378|nr:GAS2-like protein pickled eggs [Teleopsis dalmanni]